MTQLVREYLPEKLSFSTYWKARLCPASALPLKSVVTSGLQFHSENSRVRILGTFFHELVAMVATEVREHRELEKSLAEIFPQLVEKYSHTTPDVNLQYDPLVFEIHETVRKHIDLSLGPGDEVFLEKRIESRNSRIFGIPDWVSLSRGSLRLVDFKLTSDSGRLTSDRNKTQLLFYAYLVKENYGLFPERAELVGLSGTELLVEITKDESERVAREAFDIQDIFSLARFGSQSLEDMGKPSHSACMSCLYRSVCEISLSPT